MKRFFALLIAVMMLIMLPTNVVAAEVSTRTEATTTSVEEINENLAVASDTYVMATFYGYDFYSATPVKDVYLEKYCISITYRCTTQDGTYDAMYLIITDMNGGGYNKYIALDGDGLSHSMSLYLPAGNYKVQISGNINHLHTHAAVNFYGYV